jgi:tetratricopeptide (TPR) repeat protein
MKNDVFLKKMVPLFFAAAILFPGFCLATQSDLNENSTGYSSPPVESAGERADVVLDRCDFAVELLGKAEAILASNPKDVENALRLTMQAQKIFTEIFKTNSDSVALRNLSFANYKLGDVYIASGRYVDALGAYQGGLVLLQKIGKDVESSFWYSCVQWSATVT